MATLTDSTNLTGTITLSKATGTKVVLDTDKKYLTKDIELTINAPTSTITKNGATVSYTNGWVNAGSTTVTDSNLVPANIVDGVTIFGVTGNYTGVIIDETPDANGGTITTITTGATLKTQGKTNINPTTSSQTIKPDSGYNALSSVQINPIPSQYIVPSGTKTITANGDNIDVAAYASVNVNVPTSSGGGTYQAKTDITPTESSQTITPDSGYDALSSVQINAISSTYVGSGITRRSSTDLTASEATVTIPAGYYSAQTTKSVSSGSATGPSTVSGTSASVSTDTNTITLTKTNVTTTPTVSAGYVSSATASTATVTLTASVTTKAAATITPGTQNQTIASGTYLTGTQTIAGDADLVASNIISTANIFGVQGSVVINKYYTGSAAPSSSLGNNGDIYFQE